MTAPEGRLEMRLRVPASFAPALTPGTSRRVEADVDRLLAEFGVSRRAAVRIEVREVTEHAVSRGERLRPIDLLMDGQACPLPSTELARIAAVVRGSSAVTEAGLAELSAEQWDDTETDLSDALGELLVLVCRATVSARLADLVPGHPQRELLELGVPLRSDAGDQQLDGAAVGEAIADPGSGGLELAVHPGYFRSLTSAEESRNLFPLMWDGLFSELGLLPPPARISLDPALHPRGFRFRIRNLAMTPWIGLDFDSVLVNCSPDQLTSMGTDAIATINPANRMPAALVSRDHKDMLEGMDLTTWDAWEYLILVCGHTVRENAYRFMTSTVAYDMLATLGLAFPEVERAVRTIVPRELFTRVLRELLLDQVSIRDLRGIATSVARAISDPDLSGTDPVTVTRHYLAAAVAAKAGRGTGTLTAYLLDPALEANMDEAGGAQRLCDSVAVEIAGLPPTAQLPVILTEDALRRRVRGALRHQFPSLMVLGYGDVPPSYNIQAVARISPA